MDIEIIIDGTVSFYKTASLLINGEVKELTKEKLFDLAAKGKIEPETRLSFNRSFERNAPFSGHFRKLDLVWETADKVKGIVFGEKPKPKIDKETPTEIILSNATAGDAEAQFQLAMRYFSGKIISDDMLDYQDAEILLTEAAKWLRLSAEQGLVKAQHFLGIFCDDQLVDSLDPREAVLWFGKAAEQGHVESQFRLGLCFDDGKIVSERAR